MSELEDKAPELLPVLNTPDAAARLICMLREKYRTAFAESSPYRIWELTAGELGQANRNHEALAVLWALYKHMLDAQRQNTRIHKGTPLVWISDCFHKLGYPVHAKRYLMLALCEDALSKAIAFPSAP
jgi:hypothetical protein